MFCEKNSEHNDILLGKRTQMVCGKIPTKLAEAIRSCIDGDRYRSMNDVVEIALYDFVKKRTVCDGGIESGI